MTINSDKEETISRVLVSHENLPCFKPIEIICDHPFNSIIIVFDLAKIIQLNSDVYSQEQRWAKGITSILPKV